MQQRIEWHDIPAEVRAAIEARTGPITCVRIPSGGSNSAIAALLDSDGGRVFVKGVRHAHPGITAHRREAAVTPHVAKVAPALRWRLPDTGGWDVLGLDALDARHADYRPDSTDLPAVVELLQTVGEIPCPPQETAVTDAVRRWGPYLPDGAEIALLAGDALLHTDYNPENVLIGADGTARLIDWAWAARGAPWIDPCCLLLRMITTGHSPASAEHWVGRAPAWHTATPRDLDAFAVASTRLWQEIADQDHHRAWTRDMARAAHTWSQARTARRHA
ncbi:MULTISPECIES: hypothetical protein [Actinoalloteichus]|uniref:Phosphotransferase family protein n=1 Tax=Actinoalloteichus fjordicus TaxID=1612552 RepID=A0AAC9PTM9_9PSEU|nr:MULTISPECIES: hypothetical protein [Actinoalloteichus]APU16207.1 phosphotransferase family protein [Actinoalloteichus fjordicus]APU22268.1 phosphotransferase family protein [Actinoalloteichus sp. GBA129-24]